MSAVDITLSYKPRRAFLKFHKRGKRYAVFVCHRRAGKTRATINDIVLRAINTIKKDANYAYACPTFKQAKKVAWKYLKEAVAGVPNVKYNETECSVKLPNSSNIFLVGADNPDALRGNYFDGIVLDEFGDMNGRIWGEVVRPALADRMGWVVFIGTPRGKNKFYEMRELAKNDQSGKWFYLDLKASESGILPQEEMDSMREDMDEDEWAAEMECSFDAAIKGAYYAKWLNAAEAEDRLTVVPHIPGALVHSAWDLGRTDTLAIWFWQVYAGQIRTIGYYETSQMDITEVADDVEEFANNKGFRLGRVWLPHDAKAKVIGAKKSVIEQLLDRGFDCDIVDDYSSRDGIDAARQLLKVIYFDNAECQVGIERLRNYQRIYDPDRQVFSNTPKHDINSHGADAFRYMAVAIKESDVAQSLKKPAVKMRPIEARKQQDESPTINIAKAEEVCLDDLWAMQADTSGYVHI